MTKHNPERAALILEAIRRHQSAHGYPPSVRELGATVGLASTSAVFYWLERLERAGLLQKDRTTARGYRLVQPPIEEGTCQRPGCGKPIAGQAWNSKWCSSSCQAIAAHVRKWLRDTDSEYLIPQLGLTV